MQNIAKAEKEIEALKAQPLEEPSSNARGERPARGNRGPREDRHKKPANGVAGPTEEKADGTADVTKDFNALSTEGKEAPAVEA